MLIVVKTNIRFKKHNLNKCLLLLMCKKKPTN